VWALFGIGAALRGSQAGREAAERDPPLTDVGGRRAPTLWT